MTQTLPQSPRKPTQARRACQANRASGAPAANATEAIEAPSRVPLATLLTGSVLQDGEIVQLLIKPSRWFILLNSLMFSAAVVLVVTGFHILRDIPLQVTGAQVILLLVAGRLMWSALQWMGRYYIITNLRLIRLSGVFDVEIASIPLRRVSGVKVYRAASERLLSKGSLEIASADNAMMFWNTVSRPQKVHDLVSAAVSKAQQNGHGCP